MPKRIGLIYRAIYQLVLPGFRSSAPQCRRFYAAAASAQRSQVTPAPRTVLQPSTKEMRQSPPPAFAFLFPFLTKRPSLDVLHASLQGLPVVQDCLRNPTETRLLAEYISKTHPRLTPLIIRLAHRVSSGAALKKNTYECTAHHLAAVNNWNTVVAVCVLAEEHEKVSARILNWYTRALIELRDFAELNKVLDKFAKHQVSPQRRTYHLLISGYIQNGDLRRARDILRIMQANGVPPDPFTDSLIAIYYRKFGQNIQVQDRALATMDQLPPKTATAVLNALLKQRLEAEDLDGAILLVSHFHYSSIIPIIVALMHITPSVDSPFDTSIGAPPDGQTFGRIINYLASRRDFRGTMKLLEGMVEVGVKPDSNVIAGLLHLYFAVDNDDSAIQLVHAICTTESRKALEALFSPRPTLRLPFDPTRIALTTQVTNTLLRRVLSMHGLEKSIILLRVFRDEGIRPNSTTLTIILDHLATTHAPAASLAHVWREFAKEIPPDLSQLHTLVSVMLRRERYLLFGRGWAQTAAAAVGHKVHSIKTPKDARLTHISDRFDPIAGIEFVKTPKYDKLLKPIVTSLRSRNVQSDNTMFALRLQRDASRQDFDSSQAIFDILLRRGFKPNVYHYAALMEGFTRSGDVESAKLLLRSMTEADVKPNVVIYTILIVGYARQGNADEAMTTFQQMVAAGIRPDVPAIDAIASAYFAQGSHKIARQTLIELWPYIAPFPSHLFEAPLRELAVEFRALNGAPKPNRRLSGKDKQKLYQQLKTLTALGVGRGDR